jgi:adenylate cyclase
VKLASQRKKLTVFFSDIAGFTETAERLESEDLIWLLNHYLTEMSRIASAHGATIDKYVGDAIVIFFGDPESSGVMEDALACVRMAIAMRERMGDLADIWRDMGLATPFRCRMGINTGFCTVGNFGSEDRTTPSSAPG